MNARLVVYALLGAAIPLGAAVYWRLHRPAAGPLAHVENAFEFTVQGPYAEVAPLFGAWTEREWDSHWKPDFVYPQPARDVEGEVFTVSHGHTHSTWVNTALDLKDGHIQYVYVIAGAQAVLIDIHVAAMDSFATRVKVAYQRTALSQRLNQHIVELGNKDRNSGDEWQSAINGYLQRVRKK
jgi:hypothetical protein